MKSLFPVDEFIDVVYTYKNGTGAAPKSVDQKRLNEPADVPRSIDLKRLNETVFDSITTDGATMSQQNFIDGWYSELSTVGGPFPPNTSLAISYYKRIAGWAGYCEHNVPYKNFADYVSIPSRASPLNFRRSNVLLFTFSISTLQLCTVLFVNRLINWTINDTFSACLYNSQKQMT